MISLQENIQILLHEENFIMMIRVLVMQDCAEQQLLSVVLSVLDLKEIRKVWTELSVMILHCMHSCSLSPVSR